MSFENDIVNHRRLIKAIEDEARAGWHTLHWARREARLRPLKSGYARTADECKENLQFLLFLRRVGQGRTEEQLRRERIFDREIREHNQAIRAKAGV